jgi:hypothetical protein
MKYNYLERYNLIQIIQELETTTGLSKTNIKKYLSNFKQIDINSFDDEYKREIKRKVFNYKEYLDAKKNLISNKQIISIIKDFNIYLNDNYILVGNKNWNSPEDIQELIGKIEKINSFKDITTSIKELIDNLKKYLDFLKKSTDIINDNFDVLKNGKGFFKSFDNNDTLYYFFFEEKLYCVKLFITEINSLKVSDFSFFASEAFYKDDIDFFIKNYKDWAYFDLKARKLNDTKTFWLKIGAIIKSYSDELKIKYFQFSGADNIDANKPSLDSIKYATQNSFESCRTYLKANLLQLDNSKNINKISLDIINKHIDEKTDLFINDAFWFNLQYDPINSFMKKRNESLLNLKNTIEKSFEDVCKDFKLNLNKKKKSEIQTLKEDYEKYQQLLLNKLQSLNFFKKEIGVFNTFLKNLNELQSIVSEIKHNSVIKKQNLVALYRILNKISIQITVFKKSLEMIKNNQQSIIDDYDKLIIDIKRNPSSEEIIKPLTAEMEDILDYDFKIKIEEFNYKVMNLISLYIYKNEIIRDNRKKNSSKKLLIQDFIKRFEILLNNIIKKYKLDRDIVQELIEIKNSLIPEFEDVKSYKVVKREVFAKILTKTLQQVSNIEKTFTLHEDYKNRLELYIKSISDKVFKYIPSFLNFIEELKFDPQYSYFEFKQLPDPENKVGWLMSYTEESMLSLMNARDKRYYNILINDLGISKNNISFKYGNIIFKI